MTFTILEDATNAPELFVWNGAVDHLKLDEWLRSRKLSLPSDIVSFWVLTGGGDIFETETILGPFGNVSLADDVESVNDYHRQQGLDPSYLVIYVGTALTAIRLGDKKYVQLIEPNYEPHDEYDSFDEWYRKVVRAEYAERYGLPSL